MKPFLFLRGQKNYARFYVPKNQRERFGGRQYLVFPLGSGQAHEIRLRACMLEGKLWQFLNGRGQGMDIEWDKIKKYEMDLGRGIFKADGPEDHAAMLEALKVLQPSIGAFQAPAVVPLPASSANADTGPLLTELLTKFFLISDLPQPRPVKLMP